MKRLSPSMLAIGLAFASAPAPAPALPALPFPGRDPTAARVLLACPLYWHPGEPPGLFPHAAAPPAEPGGLADLSGGAALRAARRWIEVGRPETALVLLDSIPASPEGRLYRMAATAALDRWDAFGAALAEGASRAVPAGCGALVDRWSARASMARGDPAAADPAYDRLAAALPELAGYVALWRLKDANLAGDVARGERAWEAVSSAGLPAVALRDARALLPDLYERGGQPDAARRWHATLAGETGGALRAAHWLAAARLAEQAGEPAQADALRRRVIEQEPASAAPLVLDPALRARLAIGPITAARVLLAAGQPDRAELFAAAGIEESMQRDRAQEALLLRAEIRAARGDRAGAESDYGAFLARWPDDPEAPATHYEYARLALENRDGPVARRRLEGFLARWPAHPKTTAALYLLADSYQDDRAGNPVLADRAVALFDRLVREHPGSFFADRSEMRAAHLQYALGRYAEAGRRYAGYSGSESAREARYWLARSAAGQGDTGRAREIYRRLAEGGDYYALLSQDRLAGGVDRVTLTGDGYRRAPESPRIAVDAPLADPGGRAAAMLLAFGERRYAHAELERAVARLGGDRQALAAWGSALAAWGFPDLTLQIGVRLGARGERLAFPPGFAQAVDAEARTHDLDASLMLALIRQESLFDAHAVSPVGARGLMQIMPRTGGEIAAATGWQGYEPGVLFDPAVGLHFGAHYMAGQLERFEGFWPAVLAAYNGGPHNVAVWWDFPERRLDPELWIDRIPYKETREYVKKILTQYATYRRLYGASPPAR